MDIECDASTGSPDVITLGLSRAATRERLGEFREFRRTPDAPPSDAFTNGVMATYQPEDALAMLEVATPSLARYRGVALNGRAYPQVEAELSQKGIELTRVDEFMVELAGTSVSLYLEGDRVDGAQLGMA